MTGQVRRSMHSRPGAATRRAGPTVRPRRAQRVRRSLLQGQSPGLSSQTHSFLGSAAGCPCPLQGDPLLLFPKNSSKTRAGTKKKGPKALFLRLSKKRLCHFLRKQQPAARGLVRRKRTNPTTCSLRSVFPDAHAAGENRSQLDSRLRANSARLFPLSLFLLLLGLKALKSL